MFLEDAVVALVRSGAQFCIVGGVAVNMHGIPRMTYDLDVVVMPNVDSLSAVAGALERLGLRPRLPLKLEDFSDPEYRRRMWDERNLMAVTFTDPSDPLREVDVLVAPLIDAVGLVKRSRVFDLSGLAVPVIAIDDLIALKRASARAQDADDAILLERIRGAEGND